MFTPSSYLDTLYLQMRQKRFSYDAARKQYLTQFPGNKNAFDRGMLLRSAREQLALGQDIAPLKNEFLSRWGRDEALFDSFTGNSYIPEARRALAWDFSFDSKKSASWNLERAYQFLSREPGLYEKKRSALGTRFEAAGLGSRYVWDRGMDVRLIRDQFQRGELDKGGLDKARELFWKTYGAHTLPMFHDIVTKGMTGPDGKPIPPMKISAKELANQSLNLIRESWYTGKPLDKNIQSVDWLHSMFDSKAPGFSPLGGFGSKNLAYASAQQKTENKKQAEKMWQQTPLGKGIDILGHAFGPLAVVPSSWAGKMRVHNLNKDAGTSYDPAKGEMLGTAAALAGQPLELREELGHWAGHYHPALGQAAATAGLFADIFLDPSILVAPYFKAAKWGASLLKFGSKAFRVTKTGSRLYESLKMLKGEEAAERIVLGIKTAEEAKDSASARSLLREASDTISASAADKHQKALAKALSAASKQQSEPWKSVIAHERGFEAGFRVLGKSHPLITGQNVKKAAGKVGGLINDYTLTEEERLLKAAKGVQTAADGGMKDAIPAPLTHLGINDTDRSIAFKFWVSGKNWRGFLEDKGYSDDLVQRFAKELEKVTDDDLLPHFSSLPKSSEKATKKWLSDFPREGRKGYDDLPAGKRRPKAPDGGEPGGPTMLDGGESESLKTMEGLANDLVRASFAPEEQATTAAKPPYTEPLTDRENEIWRGIENARYGADAGESYANHERFVAQNNAVKQQTQRNRAASGYSTDIKQIINDVWDEALHFTKMYDPKATEPDEDWIRVLVQNEQFDADVPNHKQIRASKLLPEELVQRDRGPIDFDKFLEARLSRAGNVNKDGLMHEWQRLKKGPKPARNRFLRENLEGVQNYSDSRIDELVSGDVENHALVTSDDITAVRRMERRENYKALDEELEKSLQPEVKSYNAGDETLPDGGMPDGGMPEDTLVTNAIERGKKLMPKLTSHWKRTGQATHEADALVSLYDVASLSAESQLKKELIQNLKSLLPEAVNNPDPSRMIQVEFGEDRALSVANTPDAIGLLLHVLSEGSADKLYMGIDPRLMVKGAVRNVSAAAEATTGLFRRGADITSSIFDTFHQPLASKIPVLHWQDFAENARGHRAIRQRISEDYQSASYKLREVLPDDEKVPLSFVTGSEEDTELIPIRTALLLDSEFSDIRITYADERLFNESDLDSSLLKGWLEKAGMGDKWKSVVESINAGEDPVKIAFDLALKLPTREERYSAAKLAAIAMKERAFDTVLNQIPTSGRGFDGLLAYALGAAVQPVRLNQKGYKKFILDEKFRNHISHLPLGVSADKMRMPDEVRNGRSLLELFSDSELRQYLDLDAASVLNSYGRSLAGGGASIAFLKQLAGNPNLMVPVKAVKGGFRVLRDFKALGLRKGQIIKQNLPKGYQRMEFPAVNGALGYNRKVQFLMEDPLANEIKTAFGGGPFNERLDKLTGWAGEFGPTRVAGNIYRGATDIARSTVLITGRYIARNKVSDYTSMLGEQGGRVISPSLFADGVRVLKDAGNLYHAGGTINLGSEQMSNKNLFRLLLSEGIVNRSFSASDVNNLSNYWSKTKGDYLYHWGRAFFAMANTLDNHSRVVAYIYARREGLTHEQAVGVVRKILFDYQDLSPAVRRIGKNVMFFPTWTVKNIPRQVKLALEHPERYYLYWKTKNYLSQQGDEDIKDKLQKGERMWRGGSIATTSYTPSRMRIYKSWEHGPEDLKRLLWPFNERGEISPLAGLSDTAIQSLHPWLSGFWGYFAGKIPGTRYELNDSPVVVPRFYGLAAVPLGMGFRGERTATGKWVGTMPKRSAYLLQHLVPAMNTLEQYSSGLGGLDQKIGRKFPEINPGMSSGPSGLDFAWDDTHEPSVKKPQKMGKLRELFYGYPEGGNKTYHTRPNEEVDKAALSFRNSMNPWTNMPLSSYDAAARQRIERRREKYEERSQRKKEIRSALGKQSLRTKRFTQARRKNRKMKALAGVYSGGE